MVLDDDYALPDTAIDTEHISALTITDNCIRCGLCKRVCPSKCISSGSPYVIDCDKCTLCCKCINNCPVNAIVPV